MRKLGLIIGIIVLLIAVMPINVPVGDNLPAQAAEPSVPVPQEIPKLPPPQQPPPVIDGHGTGFRPPAMDLSYITGQRMPDGSMVGESPKPLQPLSFDWRNTNKVTSVKNQLNCGACYAFAALGNFESRVLIDTATTPPGPDYSENNAKECNWREINIYNCPCPPGIPWGSCNGGNYWMLASLFSQKGTVLETDDPYVAADVACNSGCPYNKTLLDWRIISTNSTPNTNVLKNYIMNNGPVYTTLFVDGIYGFTLSYDGSYTFNWSPPVIPDPNHAVLIVGWSNNLPPDQQTGLPGDGWIVKNSWGPGFGAGGYFYMTYDSARIGEWSSYMYDWQDYDNSGGIMYYDEDCWSSSFGYGTPTAWGLCKFIPPSDTNATRVEFWTTDTTTDIDIYIYDDFDIPTLALSKQLVSQSNYVFNEAGYHSVPLSSPLPLTAGDDVIVVVKFTNIDNSTGPVAADQNGPSETGRTYMSFNGANGSWTDIGVFAQDDVAIRLRTSGEGGEVPGDWYWKPGDWTDYAMSGMPDFDQKQDMWWNPQTGSWSYCGPVAVANSLWWFDSREEPNPIPPPVINDNYYLVASYNSLWDDHDPLNVIPLVDDLAWYMDTDGQRTAIPHEGTKVGDMEMGIAQYLVDTGYYGYYYEKKELMPSFSWIEEEVERCEDVILLLGFWQEDPVTPGMWYRVGGHYVTCAGVNSNTSQIGISDPDCDNAEAGGPGRVPVAHPSPHNASVHNDTQYVSHDIYNVVPSTSPGGLYALDMYAEGKDILNFEFQNCPTTFESQQGYYDDGLQVHSEIEYAVAVSPKPDINEVIESDCVENAAEGNITVRVRVINATWDDTIWDIEILFWTEMWGTVWIYSEDFAVPLNFDVDYYFDVPYPVMPEIVVLHFSNEAGENIGFAFSEPLDDPDLIIEDKYEDVFGCEYTVDYTVSNIGNGTAGPSTTTIFAAGSSIGSFGCPALASGDSYSDSVGPFDCPGDTLVTIVVVADVDNEVDESNEDNNWLENEMAQPLEFGDAPDPLYPSLLASDGSRHCPTDTEILGLVSMGDWKDFEFDARIVDLDIPFSDGLVTMVITEGNPAETVTFEVTDLLGGGDLLVNILIDLNRDGDWADANEHVVQNQPAPLVAGGEGTFVSVPFSTVGATPGLTWLRLTLTRTPVTVPWGGTGLFYCGETEDWEILIEELPDLEIEKKYEEVWGCEYTVNYTVTNTGNGDAGPSTTAIFAGGNHIGSFACPPLASRASFTETVGPFDCPGDTTVLITVVADIDNEVVETNEENNWMENEMEQPLEFGDAPDPLYPSLLASDGSRHCPTDTEILGLVGMGDWKDFELDARIVDLDIPFSDGLVTMVIAEGNPGETVTFEVTELMGVPDLLVNILIDLNRDGDWADANEHVAQNLPIPLAGGEGTFISAPFSTVGATTGPTWLRLTLTRTQVPVPWDGTGLFTFGETEDWLILIEEEGWYWKPGGWFDFAISGMPDFDQRQNGWFNPMSGRWSYCGPVAVANSLWWFDSREEPNPIPPPDVNDNYDLVTSYGPWDDHDPMNVIPLVDDLAWLMDTDGMRTGMTHDGTDVHDMEWGISKYLVDTGYYGYYYEKTVPMPNFYWIEGEIERCEDVVLLLGFWEEFPPMSGEWWRLGGHYVTCAGVNSDYSKLGISDPDCDNAEMGGPGRVPVAHPPHPGDPTIHNVTLYVSHDVYDVVASPVFISGFGPVGDCGLEPYAMGKDLGNFEYQNCPIEFEPYQSVYMGGPLFTVIEYAVAVSPKPDLNEVIESDWVYSAADGNVSIRVHVTDETWNNTIYDMEVLFWTEAFGTGWVYSTTFPVPLRYCQDYYFNLSYPIPPEIVVLHFSNEISENIGFAFSYEVVPGATLIGHLDFPGNAGGRVMTASFFDPGTQIEEVWSPLIGTTDASGNFTIGGLPDGTYDISVKNHTCLSEVELGIVLVDGATTYVDFGPSREGDSNGDDGVSIVDISILIAAYGTTPGDGDWNANCDYNRDSGVSITDISILIANYGDSGDPYP